MADNMTSPLHQKSWWASGGALLTAVLSSTCCWLPLVALGLGTSGLGVARLLEPWRLPLLGLTVLFWSGAAYLVYRRPHCEPGTECETPNPSLQRLNKFVLWGSLVWIMLFGAFPEYVSSLFPEKAEGVVQPRARQAKAFYSIQGMTCEGCAGGIQKALEGLEGVDMVSVSYADKQAQVVWRDAPQHAKVLEVLSSHGYQASHQAP